MYQGIGILRWGDVQFCRKCSVFRFGGGTGFPVFIKEKTEGSTSRFFRNLQTGESGSKKLLAAFRGKPGFCQILGLGNGMVSCNGILADGMGCYKEPDADSTSQRKKEDCDNQFH